MYWYECTIEGAYHAHICQSVQGLLTHNKVPMTGDKTFSSAEQLKGSVKEAIGKLTGDARVEAEGRRQKRDARTGRPGARRND